MPRHASAVLPRKQRDELKSWVRFYKEYFPELIAKLEPYHFENLKLPKKPPGFERLLVMPKGLKAQGALDACRARFSCFVCVDDLNTAVESDRTTKRTYAVWIRDRPEADEEFGLISADELRKARKKCITLLERLILELKVFDETGPNLDQKNATLCAGSRYSDGFVPYVRRWPGNLLIHGVSPGCRASDVRAREIRQ